MRHILAPKLFRSGTSRLNRHWPAKLRIQMDFSRTRKMKNRMMEFLVELVRAICVNLADTGPYPILNCATDVQHKPLDRHCVTNFENKGRKSKFGIKTRFHLCCTFLRQTRQIQMSPPFILRPNISEEENCRISFLNFWTQKLPHLAHLTAEQPVFWYKLLALNCRLLARSQKHTYWVRDLLFWHPRGHLLVCPANSLALICPDIVQRADQMRYCKIRFVANLLNRFNIHREGIKQQHKGKWAR
jgi:hypothetical protein